jgi:hypothetical protein
MPISEAAARIIARIEAKILDKINDAATNGGTFLQQVPTVTIGGMPVAARVGGLGGGLSSLSGALSTVTSAVQAAGSIASLVQNPMSLVEGAVGSAISAVSGQASAIAGQLTAGQISNLSGAISGISSTLSTFQAHTSNLSGLSSAVGDAIPDFNKIKDLGQTITAFGNETRDAFVANTASALFSDTKLNDIKDTLNATVLSKMDLIKRQDANTAAGQTAIAAYVTEITNLLNTSNNTLDTIVTTDTHNFNESGNNLTASISVNSLAEDFADANSVSYTLLSRVGKDSTKTAFNSAISESTQT